MPKIKIHSVTLTKFPGRTEKGNHLPTTPYRGVCTPNDLSWGPLVCKVCGETWSKHSAHEIKPGLLEYTIVSMTCPVSLDKPVADKPQQPTPSTIHGELGRRVATLSLGGDQSNHRFIRAQIRHTGDTPYECRMQWWRHNGTNDITETNLSLSKPFCRWLASVVKSPGNTHVSLAGSGAKYWPCQVRLMEKEGWVRVQIPVFGHPFSNRPYGVALIVKAPMVYHEVVKQLAERGR